MADPILEGIEINLAPTFELLGIEIVLTPLVADDEPGVFTNKCDTVDCRWRTTKNAARWEFL